MFSDSKHTHNTLYGFKRCWTSHKAIGINTAVVNVVTHSTLVFQRWASTAFKWVVLLNARWYWTLQPRLACMWVVSAFKTLTEGFVLQAFFCNCCNWIWFFLRALCYETQFSPATLSLNFKRIRLHYKIYFVRYPNNTLWQFTEKRFVFVLCLTIIANWNFPSLTIVDKTL